MKSSVFSRCLNVLSVAADVTETGRLFHTRAAATGKARSPTVERQEVYCTLVQVICTSEARMSGFICMRRAFTVTHMSTNTSNSVPINYRSRTFTGWIPFRSNNQLCWNTKGWYTKIQYNTQYNTMMVFSAPPQYRKADREALQQS